MVTSHSEGQPALPLPFLNLDIEPTNRCNAHCYFCPVIRRRTRGS